MKKFKFALEPVLEQRERIEDEKQQLMAQCRQALQFALDELARLDADFKRHSTALRADHQRFTTEELRLHYAHLDFLDRAMTMQEHLVAQHRAACERARLVLVDASKDRKVIDKLKSRKREAHATLERALEQRDADDANARRYARARAAQGGLS
ncbi:MAG TPA: flagellar export protein FliJ [Candidatus Baltobacteraceae bacterium]|jgi:flagellar FliJ protein